MPTNKTKKAKPFDMAELERRAAMYEKLASDCSLDASKRGYEREAKRLRKVLTVMERFGWTKRGIVNDAIIKRDYVETR